MTSRYDTKYSPVLNQRKSSVINDVECVDFLESITLPMAMTLHRAIILNGLQELSNLSAGGRDCRVVFEANGDEHWLQCTPTKMHMDWPFASPPSGNETLKACFGNSIQIDAWKVDSYVTFFPENKDVDSLIVGIDRAFQELYGLGASYTLTYRIEQA